jgi:hypothetical protein
MLSYDFFTSAAIPVIEAVLGAAFFIAALKSDKKWYLPAFVLSVPPLIDLLTLVINHNIQAYYFGLAGFAIILMVAFLISRKIFAGRLFFVLIGVCVTLAILTAYSSLPGVNMDLSLLGSVHSVFWWAMDLHIILSTFYADNDGHRDSTPIKW